MGHVRVRDNGLLWLVLSVLALAACSNNSEPTNPEPTNSEPTDSEPTIEVVVPPTLSLNAAGLAPLTAKIDLETSLPGRAMLSVADGTSSWTVEFLELATIHTLPVLGLKANRTYTIDITLLDGADRPTVLDTQLMVATEPLPDEMPFIELVYSEPERMEPGYTLIDEFTYGRGATGLTFTLIFDDAGEIVWYSEEGGRPNRIDDNGNLVFRTDNNIRTFDLLGNELSSVPLQYDGELHHDAYFSSKGTWLSLARDTVTVENFPTSVTDPDAPPADTRVLDEPAIEFAADGTFLRTWPLTEMIYPQRVGYKSLDDTENGDPADWVHSNAIIDDPSDDSIIISLRHQDAVVKFSQETGEIIWILGTHDNWPDEFQQYLLEPVGSPFRWQFSQHAPMITASGTLLLYDNGNFRESPFTGIDPLDDTENWSRGVEYDIDEDAMTVRQLWEYSGTAGETTFTPALGDADEMPTTGNVLMTFGFVTHADGVPSPDLGLGRRHTRIVEATRDSMAERVFDLRIHLIDPDRALQVYRSQRVPSLYPADMAIVY